MKFKGSLELIKKKQRNNYFLKFQDKIKKNVKKIINFLFEKDFFVHFKRKFTIHIFITNLIYFLIQGKFTIIFS